MEKLFLRIINKLSIWLFNHGHTIVLWYPSIHLSCSVYEIEEEDCAEIWISPVGGDQNEQKHLHYG